MSSPYITSDPTTPKFRHARTCAEPGDRRTCSCTVKDLDDAWNTHMMPIGGHVIYDNNGRNERIVTEAEARMATVVDLGIQLPPEGTAARRIATGVAPEAVALFVKKAADYGEHSDDLGLRGQYSDIHRKIKKLRRAMWDGEELAFEDLEEILMDLIGHCYLSIDMIRTQQVDHA